MLLRMYTRWSESHEFEVSVLDYIDGDEAGIKSVTLRIAGDNAYGYLRRSMAFIASCAFRPLILPVVVIRLFASCEVLPELDDTIEINIVPDDLKIDTFRASGAGGQHVNKTSPLSGLRICRLGLSSHVRMSVLSSRTRRRRWAC